MSEFDRAPTERPPFRNVTTSEVTAGLYGAGVGFVAVVAKVGFEAANDGQPPQSPTIDPVQGHINSLQYAQSQLQNAPPTLKYQGGKFFDGQIQQLRQQQDAATPKSHNETGLKFATPDLLGFTLAGAVAFSATANFFRRRAHKRNQAEADAKANRTAPAPRPLQPHKPAQPQEGPLWSGGVDEPRVSREEADKLEALFNLPAKDRNS